MTNAVFLNRGVCGWAFPSLPSPSPSFLVFCSCPNFLNELARKRLLRRLKTGRILDTRHQYLMNVSGFRYSRQIEFQEELMNFWQLDFFGGHPDPEITGGGGGSGHKNVFFSALRASVWSKSKGGWGGPPGPFPGSVTGLDFVPINNG